MSFGWMGFDSIDIGWFLFESVVQMFDVSSGGGAYVFELVRVCALQVLEGILGIL
jgi:hypothetical protein